VPFPRSLRSLLLLIGAAVGACLLAQFAAARTEVFPAAYAAKAAGPDLSASEPDGSWEGDLPGHSPSEMFLFLPTRLEADASVSGGVHRRLADRRSATLVGVVQLLI